MEISLVPMSRSPQDAARALSWEGNGQELVYLAKRGDELVGTISLVDFDDLVDFRHLKPWIAAFMFTRCPDQCPIMVLKLAKL